MIQLLDSSQITLLKESGRILRSTLDKVVRKAQPGISAFDLDKLAESEILHFGGKPSFKGYYIEGSGHYPSSLCVSINHEVVHGLPLKEKIFKEGDLLSLDLGVDYRGICSDMATTIYLGCPSDQISKLINTTKKCLEMGIKSAIAGNHIGNISFSIQKNAEENGFAVIKDLVGHGIGTKPHMDPQIPNYGNKNDGPKIVNGMALAIEPMITNGSFRVVSDFDGWTIKTADSSLSAHFEHTIVIIKDKPVVVTEQ